MAEPWLAQGGARVAAAALVLRGMDALEQSCESAETMENKQAGIMETVLFIAWLATPITLIMVWLGLVMLMLLHKPKVSTREVTTQSQCTYTWWNENPRFKPLPEHSHGSW